jgi:hypothetical protein
VDIFLRLFYLAAVHQIVISVSKVVFFRSSVLFSGYVVGESGFKPSPELLKTILRIPVGHLRDGNASVSWAFLAGEQFFGHSNTLSFASGANATEGLCAGLNGAALCRRVHRVRITQLPQIEHGPSMPSAGSKCQR